ncbi:MAG: DUF4488 domain-containing protein [Prevotella sp.]|jgi:hypothetical protein|nr:DUF4488 domain-containing protein [Prevotella sp.]
MKRLIPFILMTVLAVTLNIQAQETTDKPSLTGIWRLYRPAGNTGNNTSAALAATGMHKIFYENGRFANLAVSSETTSIYVYGTYEILSPTQYVEHIEKSFYSAHTGVDNVLTFKFRDANCFILSFNLPDGQKIEEIWCRAVYR